MKEMKVMKDMIKLVVMMMNMLEKQKWGQVQIMKMKIMKIWSMDLMNALVQVTVFVTYLRMRTILLLNILLSGAKLINKFDTGG